MRDREVDQIAGRLRALRSDTRRISARAQQTGASLEDLAGHLAALRLRGAAAVEELADPSEAEED